MQATRSKLKNSALLALMAGALSTGGCDEAAKFNPTWIDDVQPEIQANCIRCHSRPARGGAPEGFRLDVYRSTQLKDGTVIRGAEVMAEFIEQRAGIEGSMPPDFARGDRMRDTFKNWFKDDGAPPQLGQRANNATPRAELLAALPTSADKETITLPYRITDEDGDIVVGRVSVDGIVVADDLHSGQGEFSFYTGTFSEADHQILFEMTDGRDAGDGIRRGFIETYPIVQVVGTLTVQHADGNTAPTVSLERLIPEQQDSLPIDPDPALVPGGAVHDILVSDANGPAPLQISISDPDITDTHSISIVAFRGNEEIAVDTIDNAVATQQYDWDAAAIPEGPGWRLRITATDSGGATHTIESGSIYISHSTTTETFDSISGVISEFCGNCHFPDGRVPYLNFPLNGDLPPDTAPDADKIYYEEVHRKIFYNAGAMYLRAVEQRNMPPGSAAKLFSDRVNGGVLSDADRERIADYLLGGAPR
jgi:hypothetical protein